MILKLPSYNKQPNFIVEENVLGLINRQFTSDNQVRNILANSKAESLNISLETQTSRVSASSISSNYNISNTVRLFLAFDGLFGTYIGTI